MMEEKIHMLKKVLRKLVTLTVTVATVATMAAPVSAVTLTPKKSHSKAEITEYVDYLNDITDSWTFRADGYVPAFSVSDEDDSAEEKFSAEPGSIPYCFWQMSELLQNTPGIDDEQKAKYGSTIFSGSSPTPAGARFDMYITSMFYKQKMDSTPWLGHSKSCSTNIDDYGDKYDYQWKVLKYHTFDFSPNGASELAGKHIRKYRTW